MPMYVSHVTLKNWRNFRAVDVDLQPRTFLIGPNASGKSNFLDVFRFLRDLVNPGGGLQKSIDTRGNVSKIRCLAARNDPDIEIAVNLSDLSDGKLLWKYEIGIKQLERGYRLPIITKERVWSEEKKKWILDRPQKEDQDDLLVLSQTHLEQISKNREFREINKFFQDISYRHLVPQLLRFPNAFSGMGLPDDPFGRNFLERVAKTSEKIREGRLLKIGEALQLAVPQMKKLTYTFDPELRTPHLEVVFEHWRLKGAKQREDQFSDGTLRLLSLLWFMLEGDSLLLLEEPELSLNSAIVKELAGIFHRLMKKRKRQLILSSHSPDLLSAKGIHGREVILLSPTQEDTRVSIADSDDEIRDLIESGMSIADAVIPATAPKDSNQLAFIFTD